ncbi:transmembrane protein 185B-like isoform X1 [Octopus sinensis]|uniref:Transmembrane protein 185B-like isoform X1 n=1 Tax=Octopus sinensis TaxID=2607531 RepID=A0A7E6F8R2_9MOLL|nr:transmembrane protein 185B-like isoform X1 [Octopus sinensis]
MAMNLRNLFQDFNPSQFLVFSSLLVFSLLFSLRLDETIQWSYWLVFLPIWLWKVMVVAGASVGSYIWWRNPQYRVEGDGYVQYKAMVICTGMHLLLLMFEILACDNLENKTHSWILVFIPLIFMSVVSIGICIWAVKNERSFEFAVQYRILENPGALQMELFCAVNILQFIFLALRLDNFILWNWVIVFIPIWIVMCIAMIGMLYRIILTIILMKSPDLIPEQRRGNLSSAIAYSFLVIPLLTFEILLANRLDSDNNFKYSAITVPLLISLMTLICMAFGCKGGNHWWFGIRKDFCQFLLGVFPLLQEYGNISYSLQSDEADSDESSSGISKLDSLGSKPNIIEEQPRIVVPIISIETPD